MLGAARLDGPSRQGVVNAFVELADSPIVVSLFVDFKIGAHKECRRQFLDREANGFGGSVKPLIAKAMRLRLARIGREQLGFGTVVKCDHSDVLQDSAVALKSALFLGRPNYFGANSRPSCSPHQRKLLGGCGVELTQDGVSNPWQASGPSVSGSASIVTRMASAA